MAETSPNCEDMEICRTAVPTGFCTPRQINDLNRECWLQQSQLTDKLMSDEAVLWNAISYFESQQILKTPLKYQKSFEWALLEADKTIYGEARRLKEFRTALARKGGAAAKGDALHKLIDRAVQKNPDITVPQLEKWLADQHEIIFEIDEESGNKPRKIHYTDRGRDRSAPTSGLKDRLSRARKKIAARKQSTRAS